MCDDNVTSFIVIAHTGAPSAGARGVAPCTPYKQWHIIGFGCDNVPLLLPRFRLLCVLLRTATKIAWWYEEEPLKTKSSKTALKYPELIQNLDAMGLSYFSFSSPYAPVKTQIRAILFFFSGRRGS